MMMEEAGTLETTVVFLTVSPHEATPHTDRHQDHKCGGGGCKKTLKKDYGLRLSIQTLYTLSEANQLPTQNWITFTYLGGIW